MSFKEIIESRNGGCSLSFIPREDALFRMSLQTLSSTGGMEEFVRFFVQQWKAERDVVAATYLGSWLGALCSDIQYFLSHYDGVPVLTLNRLTLQVLQEGEKRRSLFILKDDRAEQAPAQQRSIWRSRQLDSFYRQELRPILETAQSVTGAPMRELWGQLVTRMYNDHEKWLKVAASEEQRQKIRDDFDALRYGLEAGVFGLSKNPFDMNHHWIESPDTPGESIRMRAACCQAYLTGSGQGYCYSCPRMGKEERELKLQAIRKAM